MRREGSGSAPLHPSSQKEIVNLRGSHATAPTSLLNLGNIEWENGKCIPPMKFGLS